MKGNVLSLSTQQFPQIPCWKWAVVPRSVKFMLDISKHLHFREISPTVPHMFMSWNTRIWEPTICHHLSLCIINVTGGTRFAKELDKIHEIHQVCQQLCPSNEGWPLPDHHEYTYIYHVWDFCSHCIAVFAIMLCLTLSSSWLYITHIFNWIWKMGCHCMGIRVSNISSFNEAKWHLF